MIKYEDLFDRNISAPTNAPTRRLMWKPFKGFYWETIDPTASNRKRISSNQPQITWSPPEWLTALFKALSSPPPEVKKPPEEMEEGTKPSLPSDDDRSVPRPIPSIPSITKQEGLMQHVIKLYKEAVAGDKKAIEESLKILEELHSKDPDDTLVQSLYGGVIALLARDTVERLAKGLQERYDVNQSVGEDPNSALANRLKTFLTQQIPGDFFQRTHIAIEYFKYLISLFQESPELLRTEFYWDILYHLGRAYHTVKSTRGANAIWTKLWYETTDSMYRKLLEHDGFQPTGELVDADAWLKPSNFPIQLWSKPVLESVVPQSAETGDSLFKGAEALSPDSRSEAEPLIPTGEPVSQLEKDSGVETVGPEAPAQQLAFDFAEPMVESSGPVGQDLMKPESFIPAIEAGLKTIDPLKIEEPVLSSSELQPLLEEGIGLFRQGMAGNRQAIKAAHEVLHRAHEIAPENLDAMAYYASSAFLLCLDTSDASQMFDHAIKGITLLNKVVNRDSGNPNYRMLRASLFNTLPESHFHLTRTAIDDFNAAIAAYEQNHTLFPADVYRQMLKDLAAAYQKVNQEEKARMTLGFLKKQYDNPGFLN